MAPFAADLLDGAVRLLAEFRHSDAAIVAKVMGAP